MSELSNQPKDMGELVRQHRSLAILKALKRETSQSANENVIREWVEGLALGGTREQVRIGLERLATMGLIRTEWRGFENDTLVFWLTEAGVDYLEFRVSVEALPRIGPSYDPY